jgi:hypothetical protein
MKWLVPETRNSHHKSILAACDIEARSQRVLKYRSFMSADHYGAANRYGVTR